MNKFMISVLLALALLFQNCTYMARYVLWQGSDIKDYKKFPKQDIHSDQPYFFSKADAESSVKEVLYHWDLPRKNIETLLQDNETTAFIVIQNDRILYENYFNGYERSSINTSFSVAKSITSLLIGIAIDEGFIKNSNDPITNYLPELKKRDARFEKITIDHLLDMKSGLKFVDNDLPWGDRVKAYYSPRLRKKLLKLKIESEPGTIYEYNTYHPQLLGLILERTTRKSPAQYLEEKIWKPLGMEFDASWSVDSKRDNMVKMESGINCRAIDLAKIGKIILEKGKYNNQRIVSEEWIEKLTNYNDTNRFPGNELIHYESAWWTLESFRGYRHTVYADGHLGQFLFVFPEDNTIIIRMGKKMGKETESVFNWLVIGSDIINRVNKK